MKLVENEWERGVKKPARARQERRTQEGQDGEAVHQASAQREEGNSRSVKGEETSPKPGQAPSKPQDADEKLTPGRAGALPHRACLPHANLGAICPSWPSANVPPCLAAAHPHRAGQDLCVCPGNVASRLSRAFCFFSPSISVASSFSCPPTPAQLLFGGFAILSPSKPPLGFKSCPSEKRFDGTSM